MTEELRENVENVLLIVAAIMLVAYLIYGPVHK